MFQEELEIGLDLTIGSDRFSVPGGAVKQFDIEAHTWGFEASVMFCISSEREDDAVFPRFITDDLIRVTLQLRSQVHDVSGPKAVPLKLIGYVAEKSLVETVGNAVAGVPVLVRRYWLRFRDAAALFWKQHHPIELYVDTSISKVLDSHKAEGISLSYGAGPFSFKQKLIFLGESKQTSFYDFVCWYLSANNAVMELNAADSTYVLSKMKGKLSTVQMEPEDLAQIDVTLPSVLRHDVGMLNSNTESHVNQKVPVTTSVTGVRRDVLYTTPIATNFMLQTATEVERTRAAKDGLHLTLARFPQVEFLIGTLVGLGELFSKNMHAAKDEYRIHHLSVHGKAAGESAALNAGLDDVVGTHDVQFEAELENKSDPTLRLPAFTPPDYPTHVEAKIVSFSGEDKDRTWFSIEDEATSLMSYQLDVPLFNKKIEAPFGPSLMTGHFFFPAYKHARVLVALYFDRAEIIRHLDWADNAKLPKDTQGNQIVFGYQASNGTILQHVYKDSKPELHLNRTFGNDTQTLEVSEGLMRWKVQELTTVAPLEPKYDVSVQVEGAKGTLSTKVGGSVSQLGGSFQGSSSSTVAAISGATDEVESSVTNMESSLDTRIEQIKAEIQEFSGTLMDSFDSVSGAIAAAKAAIIAEVES